MQLTAEAFAKKIEFSLVRPDATDGDIEEFCRVVRENNFAAACVNPVNVSLTAKLLRGTGIDISASVGFPFGSHIPEIKALEAKRAIEMGATQIDMVINIGALKSKRDEIVLEDIRGVVEASGGAPVKVILENGFLTDEEKVRGCKIARDAGASFVKTSTGVESKYLLERGSESIGATVRDVKLMKEALGDKVKVKAAGRIYDLDFALELIGAGADRLGTSRGPKLIREFKERFGDRFEI
ncbi:MAG: deoxyribose-phosphate aldolase [bacterium]